MSKALIFVALFFYANVFLRVSCELVVADWTHDMVLSSTNSSTVPFNGHLYTLTKNESHIHINSTDSSYKACDIAINANRDTTRGRLEMTANDKEIFIVGINSWNERPNEYIHTILSVDPIACSYQSLFVPEINNWDGYIHYPKVIRHRTGIDVFFPSLKNCTPCRLNNEGLRVTDSIRQITRENVTSIWSKFSYYMRYVDSLDAYYYVYHGAKYPRFSQTSILKLLDRKDLSIKKEKIIDFPVYAVSKQKKQINDLGICVKVYNGSIGAYTVVRCDRFNSNLDTISSIRIPIDGDHLSRISYEFDEEGNSYISFGDNEKLQLYIYNKDGKLIEAIDMGAINQDFSNTLTIDALGPEENEGQMYSNQEGYLVGDQYCIINDHSFPFFNPTPRHHIRCINVAQYFNDL